MSLHSGDKDTLKQPRKQNRRVIFCVNDYGALGGTNSAMRLLAKEFKSRGFTVEVISHNPPASGADMVVPSSPENLFIINKLQNITSEHRLAQLYPGPFGVKLAIKRTLTIPWKVYRDARLLAHLRKFDESDNFILLEAGISQFISKYISTLRGKNKGPGVFMQFHGSMDGMKAWGSESKIASTLPHLDALLALTEEYAQDFADAFNAHVGVLPNPVNDVLDKIPVLKYRKKLIFLGRMSDEKRVDLLLHAFSLIAQKHPEWTLELYGTGPAEDKWKALAAKLLSEDRINFHGYVSNVIPEIDKAGLCVLQSSFEALPMALTECAARGVPGVTTNSCSGARKIAEKAGYLCEDDSPEGLASVLDEAISDIGHRQELSKKCLELASAFSSQKIGDSWVTLFASRSPNTIPHKVPKND
ncbi:glycosyltransferase [Dermabacteraceae bacterium TAE3-ERU5]|nr:glycosyltransferase [Dermabacteraceae bacterium TAE3-ERU5]